MRRAFDPDELAAEIDASFAAEGVRGPFVASAGGNSITGHYRPMMCEHTPVSLALADHLATVAEQRLDSAVVPGRAKGVLYMGNTGWHRDTELAVRSMSFVAYLDPLHADNGALCVLPGSHVEPHATEAAMLIQRRAQNAGGIDASSVGSLPSLAIATEPGDMIVFDEHLFHTSFGGRVRRQWRVDFAAAPRDQAEEALLRRYFEDQYAPGWDGGYDVDRFPSYGEHWRRHARPEWLQVLERLGVFKLVALEEAAARERPRRTP